MEFIIDMYKELMSFLKMVFSELTRRSRPVSTLEFALLRTAVFVFLLAVVLVSALLTLLCFSGWALLFMKFLITANLDFSTGFVSDIVPVLSGMTWFRIAVPVSCVVLFLLMLDGVGFSVTRLVANSLSSLCKSKNR